MNTLLKYVSIGLIGASALLGSCASTKPTVSSNLTQKVEETKYSKDSTAVKTKVQDSAVETKSAKNYEQSIADLTVTLKDTLRGIDSTAGKAYTDTSSTAPKIYVGKEDGADKIIISVYDQEKRFNYTISMLEGKRLIPSTTINIKKDGKLVASFLDYYGFFGFKTDSTGAKIRQYGRYGLDFFKNLQTDKAIVQKILYDEENAPIKIISDKLNENYAKILSFAISEAGKIKLKADETIEKTQKAELGKKKEALEAQIKNASILPFSTDEETAKQLEELNKITDEIVEVSKAKEIQPARLNKLQNVIDSLNLRKKQLDSLITVIDKAETEQTKKANYLDSLSASFTNRQKEVDERQLTLAKYEESIKSRKDRLDREYSNLKLKAELLDSLKNEADRLSKSFAARKNSFKKDSVSVEKKWKNIQADSAKSKKYR